MSASLACIVTALVFVFAWAIHDAWRQVVIVEVVEPKTIGHQVTPGRCRIAFDAYWNGKPEPQYFLWSCPVCGHAWSGWLAGPRSSPFTHEWTLTGSREQPTLSPSLVCAMARPEVAAGRPLCPGHGFIQEGQWR